MKAEEISVDRLFKGDQQFLVPRWQRHYSWDEAQWSELWDDLRRVQEDGLTSHFLGSIVLKIRPWSGQPSEAQGYWVVDGQQRIATLTLLVCAIRDRLAQLEGSVDEQEAKKAEYTSQLLRNLNLKENYQDRLVLQERDQAHLAPLVRGTWDGALDTLIERCYRFFKDRLTTMPAGVVEALLGIVNTRLSAVWVTLEDGDNPHRVFQTLNAGGKPLRQGDLVRNYFFLLLRDDGDEFYGQHWRQMESRFSERQLEDYFVAWAISEGHAGSKHRLFGYFHQDLLPYEADVASVIKYGKDLVEISRYYQWVLQPSGSDYNAALKKTLTDLQNWGITTSEGLIIFLLRRHAAEQLSSTDLLRSLEIILSFMARRQIAGYEPNVHRSIFVSAARKLYAAPNISSKEIADYLHYILSIGEDVRRWPTDEGIGAAIQTTPIYSKRRSGWTLSILERINRGMFKNQKHAPDPLDRTKYSVEHLMPQTLSESWVADLETWGVTEPAQMHEALLHVLGNLTITPINSSLGNLPLASKLEQLQDDPLRLNVKIADSTAWGEARIRERSIELSRIACEVYVAPLSGPRLQEASTHFAHLHEAESEGSTDGLDETDED